MKKIGGEVAFKKNRGDLCVVSTESVGSQCGWPGFVFSFLKEISGDGFRNLSG